MRTPSAGGVTKIRVGKKIIQMEASPRLMRPDGSSTMLATIGEATVPSTPMTDTDCLTNHFQTDQATPSNSRSKWTTAQRIHRSALMVKVILPLMPGPKCGLKLAIPTACSNGRLLQ